MANPWITQAHIILLASMTGCVPSQSPACELMPDQCAGTSTSSSSEANGDGDGDTTGDGDGDTTGDGDGDTTGDGDGDTTGDGDGDNPGDGDGDTTGDGDGDTTGDGDGDNPGDGDGDTTGDGDGDTTPECPDENECTLPRVMILLDASSSMLNADGGIAHALMGETSWDHVRGALTGETGLFDLDLGVATAGDVALFGLSVFGYDFPEMQGVEEGNIGEGLGEARILAQYGPCMKDNVAWALDPQGSCELPGCDDPWGGPPIVWSFKDGQVDPPGFNRPTLSHMPQCAAPEGQGCAGSGTFTYFGLQLINDNQAQYALDASNPMAEYPANGETHYFNILITDGVAPFVHGDLLVEEQLVDMVERGVTTYVIATGPFHDDPWSETKFSNYANWGSGGTEDHFPASNQAEIELALQTILGDLEFDPCCVPNDCSQNPEP